MYLAHLEYYVDIANAYYCYFRCILIAPSERSTPDWEQRSDSSRCWSHQVCLHYYRSIIPPNTKASLVLSAIDSTPYKKNIKRHKDSHHSNLLVLKLHIRAYEFTSSSFLSNLSFSRQTSSWSRITWSRVA